MVVLDTFTRTGYTFQGWSTSSSSSTVAYTNGQSVSNLTTTDGGVVNLYAVWKINTYTVSVVVNNGTVTGSTSKTVNYNSNGTFTVNPSTGYSTPTVSCTNSQNGSISGSTLTVSNVTANTTCTVTYKPITYTISYTLNGGSVTGNPSSYTVESNTITLKNPTKTGYTFTGWTGSNGSTAQTTVTIPKGSTGNKSYTANYRIKSYTVRATVNNGTISGSTSKSVNYNSSTTFSLTPTTWYGNPTVSCTNGQRGSMNGNTLTVSNVTNSTTCTVTYNQVCIDSDVVSGSAAEKIINMSPSETETLSSTGLYKRENTGTYDQISCNTDYRYAGLGPNNYVTFNGESWRIVGVFETENEDGEFAKRVKIVKNTQLQIDPTIVWDTSRSSINSGMGISQWGESGTYEGADLMRTLNTAYYNRTTGTCYTGPNGVGSSCTFASIGLNSTARNMVDTVKWYTGTSDIDAMFYESYGYERSYDHLGSTGTGETVTRTSFWYGKVGLLYASDYGYADGNSSLGYVSIMEDYSPGSRNWIFRSGEGIPFITTVDLSPDNVLRIVGNTGAVSKARVGNRFYIRPAVYLKPTIKITGGSGTSSSPYTLSR